MKIRSLLTVVALLSIVFLGVGTAHAIYGVADDVPGQDQVWPIICAVTPSASNSLNTNWAIADVIGGTPNSAGLVSHTSCVIEDSHTRPGPDFDYFWTNLDVVVDDCQSLLTRNPAAKITTAGVFEPTLTIGSTTYYVLYVKCVQDTLGGVPGPVVDRYMNNVYLVDLPQGFASGFNGPSLENGTDKYIGENGGGWHITASNVYARYYINNDPTVNTNTWDWFIFLLGRNQYNTVNIVSTRTLTGTVCDEDEHCTSAVIPIPWELNIFNVAPTLPGSPFFTPLGNLNSSVPQTFPKAGFYALTISEPGNRTSAGPFTISGTSNNTSIFGDPANPYYSLFGWSYERAQASSILADFDVIHPVFRKYCTGSSGSGVDGTGPADNLGTCGCTGAGC